jgi:hypothetical protein
VKIPAIAEIPGISSIHDVAGNFFKWKSQESLKTLGSQASPIVPQETCLGGNPSRSLKTLESQASPMPQETRLG